MGNEAIALTRIKKAAHAAGAMGAAMLVLPEVFLPGYNHAELATRAILRNSALLRQVADICHEAGCGIVVGYAEREGEYLYNAAVAFDAAGREIAHYRKIQLFGRREQALYAPGKTYTTFELNGQKAAILICYDVEFAPHVSALAEQGVTLVLVPTANMEPFDHVVRHTVPTMAANYGVTIVYANYCGRENDLAYVGGSLIAGPHGEVLAQAGCEPALLVVTVPVRNPKRLSSQREDYRMAPE
jgi:5-aminopentanamidase